VYYHKIFGNSQIEKRFLNDIFMFMILLHIKMIQNKIADNEDHRTDHLYHDKFKGNSFKYLMIALIFIDINYIMLIFWKIHEILRIYIDKYYSLVYYYISK
jgi:hypothetical protein